MSLRSSRSPGSFSHSRSHMWSAALCAPGSGCSCAIPRALWGHRTDAQAADESEAPSLSEHAPHTRAQPPPPSASSPGCYADILAMTRGCATLLWLGRLEVGGMGDTARRLSAGTIVRKSALRGFCS